MSDMDFTLDVDMESFEAELQEDVLTSDSAQRMEISPKKSPKKNDVSSDDLWDVTFDDLKAEDLEAIDLSSNSATLSNTVSQKPLVDEDETLFLQGYDELMDIDYEETQPLVKLFCSSLTVDPIRTYVNKIQSHFCGRDFIR